MQLDVGTFILINNYEYGRVLYEVISNDLPCTRCGGNDKHRLEVVADRNVGLTNGVYTMPNARATQFVDETRANPFLEQGSYPGMGIEVCSTVIAKEKKADPNNYKIITDPAEKEYRNKLLMKDEKY